MSRFCKLIDVNGVKCKRQTRAPQEFCLEHGFRLSKMEPTMKLEEKEDSYCNKRCDELEQENEFLKCQMVVLERTIVWLQSGQTATVVP